MPNSASYRTALEVEKELLKSLAEKEPTFAEISHYLSELVAAPLSCRLAVLWVCAQNHLTVSVLPSSPSQIPLYLSKCYPSRLRDCPLRRCRTSPVGCASQDQHSLPQIALSRECRMRSCSFAARQCLIYDVNYSSGRKAERRKSR